MSLAILQAKIEEFWETQRKPDSDTLDTFLQYLDAGYIRSATCVDGAWQAETWVKKGILLYLRHVPTEIMGDAPAPAYDKIPLKTQGWQREDFEKADFRLVPGTIIRKGSYVAPKAVLMPSFINIGAYVGEGTMIDTMARVGSCVQVGKNCHISGGVGLGGVLEPLQATPVIIEDDCFIGAQSQIVEGTIVGKGSVLGMNTFVGASTKIIRRDTQEVLFGHIPPYSVVVPGSYTSSGGLSVNCAIIIKEVTPETRKKASTNDLLRF